MGHGKRHTMTKTAKRCGEGAGAVITRRTAWVALTGRAESMWAKAVGALALVGVIVGLLDS